MEKNKQNNSSVNIKYISNLTSHSNLTFSARRFANELTSNCLYTQSGH